MNTPRLVLCGGIELDPDHPLMQNRLVIKLDTQGPNPNVYLKLEDVAKVFLKQMTPRLTDLLEIASYVYAADTAAQRGQSWKRDFQFIISVRDFDFWTQPDVSSMLTNLLKFITDDVYAFEFRQITEDRPLQEYLAFDENDEWPFYDVDKVVMFSGGLDSLAGAVEMASEGRKLVLVSHRPAAVITSRQRDLFDKLKETFSSPMLHIPVCINKRGDLRREASQRSRSFLYSALGFVMSQSLRGSGVLFYENGIVSLNLPVADEVLGSRATRTTHPWALGLLSEFYSLFSEKKISIENPFILMTKRDVVSRISSLGAGDLIKLTCSCSRTMYQSKNQRHCGTCSQCIDRRIAIIAAGQEHNDIETDYGSDVFTGPRKNGYEQNMAVNYIRHAVELCKMSNEEIGSRFGSEILRAVRGKAQPEQAAHQIINMHRRHGEIVEGVVADQIKLHVNDLINGSLEPTSMLAKVFGQKHLESTWTGYADRICELLAAGLPAMCLNNKPKNEPELQRWCDGILQGSGESLQREFPFLKWASVRVKPDWAETSLSLWIELKYVRKTTQMSKITDEIAADITKYGDNGQRILFIVYDPGHRVVNEREFARDIDLHDGMTVRFIR